MIYDLARFIEAYRRDYDQALAEIKNGKKVSHWMWYIFPQINGLGKSAMSKFYATQNVEEAQSFLSDSYLGVHFREICAALLTLDTNDARSVFGSPDDKKLRSSMTLFGAVSEENSVFQRVLEKYFDGKPDARTLRLLEGQKP